MARGKASIVKRVARTRLFVYAQFKNTQKRRVAGAIFLVLLALMLVQTNDTKADTQGANSPSAAANDNSIGGTAWANPSNATTSNNGYATVSLSNGGTSQYIKTTGFGFSIPTGATINGIVAEVERSEANSNGGNVCRDNAIRIVKAGSTGTTDQSQSGD